MDKETQAKVLAAIAQSHVVRMPGTLAAISEQSEQLEDLLDHGTIVLLVNPTEESKVLVAMIPLSEAASTNGETYNPMGWAHLD